MKMADGGFRLAFNVQFAADTESTAIAAVSVDNNGSDMGKMATMSDALAEQYDERPGQHLADGGFAKLDDIETLARNGVEAFVPVPKPCDANRDRHAPCRGDPPAVAAWRQRMGDDAAKDIYKERAATVELANAQARNHGLTRFVVRGLEKVKAATLWFALAHNMICGWRLIEARTDLPRRNDATAAANLPPWPRQIAVLAMRCIPAITKPRQLDTRTSARRTRICLSNPPGGDSFSTSERKALGLYWQGARS